MMTRSGSRISTREEIIDGLTNFEVENLGERISDEPVNQGSRTIENACDDWPGR